MTSACVKYIQRSVAETNVNRWLLYGITKVKSGCDAMFVTSTLKMQWVLISTNWYAYKKTI